MLHSDAVFESGDARSCTLLLHSTVLDTLAVPLSTDQSTKSMTEKTKSIVTDFLANLLCPPTTTTITTAAACPAALIFDALLALVELPKQKDMVLKDIARVIVATMKLNQLAGSTLVTSMLNRLSNGSSHADNLAALLSIVLSSSINTTTTTTTNTYAYFQACFMGQCDKVCALLEHSRVAVRKSALEILSALSQFVPLGTQIAIAAIMKTLHDKDANLRAKALLLFENQAAAGVLAFFQDETCFASVTPEYAACSLGACLVDRSVTVRKRAASTLAVLVMTNGSAAATLAQRFIAALHCELVPVLCGLLQLPRGSKLYPGETSSSTLCDVLICLVQSLSQSESATLCLLRLHRSTPDEATRTKLEASIVNSCLPPSRGANFIFADSFLAKLLSSCRRRDVFQLREILLNNRKEIADRELIAMACIAEQASTVSMDAVLPLTRAIYVLKTGNEEDEDDDDARGQCQWLLQLTDTISSQLAALGTHAHESLFWCLKAAAAELQQSSSQLRAAVSSQVANVVWKVAVTLVGCTPEHLEIALSMLKFMPDPRTVFTELLSCLAATAGITTSQSPHVSSLLSKKATTSFLTVLSATADVYLEEKSRFLACLQQQNLVRTTDGMQEENGEEDENDAMETDCLQAEGEARAQECAAQKYLEELLEAEDTVPAAFVPALLTIVAASSTTETLKHSQQARAAAIRVLQRLSVLSRPLAGRCLPTITALMDTSTTQPEMVLVAAIDFLKDAIGAYPTAFGDLLHHLAPLLSSSRDHGSSDHASSDQKSTFAAAQAFVSLILTNKLKVYDFLGIMGRGLASCHTTISSLHVCAMKLLLDGATGPADRAALLLGVVQQTPIGHERCAATVQIVKSLMRDCDKQHDAVIGPCIAAALTAGTRAAATNSPPQQQLQATLIMLRVLCPSVKMLRALQTAIEGSGGASLSSELKKELKEFVGRARGGECTDDDDDDDDDNNNGTAEKEGRKRGRGGKAAVVAQLQQTVLGLLNADVGGQPRRERQQRTPRP